MPICTLLLDAVPAGGPARGRSAHGRSGPVGNWPDPLRALPGVGNWPDPL